MAEFNQTALNKVKRGSNRAIYNKDQVYDILDSHFICHVCYIYEGSAICIPTGYGRQGDVILLHGAFKNRMLLSLLESEKVSLTVTHLDGFVLARSVFNHSFNYRSAVVFGKARLIEDPEEKNDALRTITENIIPGRWEEARLPNEKELKITTVIAIGIDEASAKVRTGPPIDHEEDYNLDIWAGVLPLQTVPGKPISDEALKRELPIADSAMNYKWGSTKIIKK